MRQWEQRGDKNLIQSSYWIWLGFLSIYILLYFYVKYSIFIQQSTLDTENILDILCLDCLSGDSAYNLPAHTAVHIYIALTEICQKNNCMHSIQCVQFISKIWKETLCPFSVHSIRLIPDKVNPNDCEFCKTLASGKMDPERAVSVTARVPQCWHRYSDEYLENWHHCPHIKYFHWCTYSDGFAEKCSVCTTQE